MTLCGNQVGFKCADCNSFSQSDKDRILDAIRGPRTNSKLKSTNVSELQYNSASLDETVHGLVAMSALHRVLAADIFNTSEGDRVATFVRAVRAGDILVLFVCHMYCLCVFTHMFSPC